MAEMVMQELVRQAGREAEFEIASAAVSTEEIGNDIYPPAQRTLAAHGIPYSRRRARQVTRADFDYYDHIVCADRSNIRMLNYNLGISADTQTSARLSLLMQWAGEDRDVSDPWYTRDFEKAYRDILTACHAMLAKI